MVRAATVDRFGYAILPSLAPYRYKTTMNDKTELQGGSQRVVTYAGALAQVSFSTLQGRAVLIATQLEDGSFPLMGADVVTAAGNSVGMVGQVGKSMPALPKTATPYRWYGTSRLGSNVWSATVYRHAAATLSPILICPVSLGGRHDIAYHILSGSAVVLLLGCQTAYSACIRVTSATSLSQVARNAGYTATAWNGACDTCNGRNIGMPGVISLSSGTFQPSGTLLASSSISFLSQGAQTAFTANQILFRCAVADASSLFEMYATNGDSGYAGMYAASEIDGAYYSYVRNVAVRLTHLKSGAYFSRYWQGRQLTPSDWFSYGTYIYIPASAFSDILMEVFRIDSTTWYGNAYNRYTYLYSQPHGYTAFKGPWLSRNVTEGADSATKYEAWPYDWPGTWSLYATGVTFVRGASCRVDDFPNVVMLPLITANQLR